MTRTEVVLNAVCNRLGCNVYGRVRVIVEHIIRVD